MVVADLGGAERLHTELRQVVALLGDVGAFEYLRVLDDQLVPPAGSRLLDSDPHEVRRSSRLAPPEDGGREVEAALPWGVVAPGVQ